MIKAPPLIGNRGACQLAIPADALHTKEHGILQIRWLLGVEARLPGLPAGSAWREIRVVFHAEASGGGGGQTTGDASAEGPGVDY